MSALEFFAADTVLDACSHDRRTTAADVAEARADGSRIDEASRIAAGSRAFIAGEENRLSLASAFLMLDDAARIADRNVDGDAPAAHRANPLVLHGSSGTGKTLLCDVLVDEWRSRFPEHRLVRLDATEFARRYAQAVDADAIEPLRTEWRGADLLVVEDLQRIGSKQQAQWELLHTLDALEQRGSYVVVTLETPPSQLDALLPGIVSRLTAGLVVATAPPSTATRRAIIERFATARRWNVEAKVLDILAADLETGVPELLGTMAGLEASARADDQSFDAAYVRRYLDHRADTRAPTLKAIAETTARHFGLKVADLKSSSRRRTAVAARDAAVFLARRMTNKSLQEIGAYFGGRDHTTILHSFRKIEASLGGDAVVRQTFETLRNRLGKIG